MLRSSIPCLILLLGAMPAASQDETAERARALFKKRSYSEAATLARQVFAQQPAGRAADDLRILLCKAKRDGKDVGAPAANPDSQPLQVAGDVQRPERISGPNPQFSDRARKAGDQGQVLVTALIDQDGCVTEIKLDRGLNKYADQDVLDVVRQWVFRPALFEGKPVDVHYTLIVNVRFG